MNSDPFAKSRPGGKPQVREEPVTKNEMPKEEATPTKSLSAQVDEWSDPFAKSRPKQGTIWDAAKRYATQTAAAPVKAIGTIPGNLLRLIHEATLFVPEKVAGQEFKEYRKNFESTAAMKLLPGSKEGKEALASVTGGLSEPQTENEQSYIDTLELGTLLATAAENPSSWGALGKAAGTAVLAQGSKRGAKALGFEETGQAVAELGTVFLSALYKPQAIQNYLNKQYNALFSSPAAKRIGPTTGLETSLKNIQTEWSKGGTTPAIRGATPKLNELIELAEKGNAEVEEVLTAWQKVNKELQAKGLFESLDAGGKADLRNRYNELKDVIDQWIKSVTPKNFYDAWKAVREGWNTFFKSRRVDDWVKDHKDPILKAIGGSAIADLYFATNGLGPAILGGAAGIALNAVGKVLYRVANSKNLRKYYTESMKHIAEENTPAALNSIKKLDKEYQKETATPNRGTSRKEK